MMSEERTSLLEQMVSSASVQKLIDDGERERAHDRGAGTDEGARARGGGEARCRRRSATVPLDDAAGDRAERRRRRRVGRGTHRWRAANVDDKRRRRRRRWIGCGATGGEVATTGGGDGGEAEAAAAARDELAAAEAKFRKVKAALDRSRNELTQTHAEADGLRARAATAEGKVSELERKLRQQVARLRQLSQAQQSQTAGAAAASLSPLSKSDRGPASSQRAKGGGGDAGGADRVASLQAELAAKQKEMEAKDQELSLLKEMVRARKADARTRELKQEVSARRSGRQGGGGGGEQEQAAGGRRRRQPDGATRKRAVTPRGCTIINHVSRHGRRAARIAHMRTAAGHAFCDAELFCF